MDFDSLILAHARWKTFLHNAIHGKEKFDPVIAGRDDRCELGHWLHGEGRKFASHAVYRDLVEKHAAFHLCVADVLRKMVALSREEALKLLDPIGTDYGRTSAACINALGAMKRAFQPK